MRKPETKIGQSYCNLALAIQQVTEQIVLQLATTAKKLTGSKNLVMAGGVALNSVANGKLQKSGLFEELWIQPAAGDAGGAVGAALAARHIFLNNQKENKTADKMQGTLLGPEFSNRKIFKSLTKHQANATLESDFDSLCEKVAALLAEGKIVGWFQRRMEFGPRALGNRSILADARNREMQKRLNLQIKFREGFRPFAPAVLWENTSDYFDVGVPFNETFTGQLIKKPDTSEMEILNAAAVSYSPRIHHLKTKYLIEEVGLKFDEIFVFIDLSDIQNETVYQDFNPQNPGTNYRLFFRLKNIAINHSFTAHTLTKFKKSRQTARFLEKAEVFDEYRQNEAHVDALELYASFFSDFDDNTLLSNPQFHGVSGWLYDENFAEKNGIGFINLYPAFINPPVSAALGMEFFIPNDNHWNKNGHWLVANELHEYLTNKE